MGLLDKLTGAVGDVTISSSLLPPVVLRAPLSQSDGPDSGPGFLLWLLQPKVSVQTAAGELVIAPAGDPPAFPWVGLTLAVGMAALGALAVYGALRLVR